MPPEGLQLPQDSAGKGSNLVPEVAECAALSGQRSAKSSEATSGDAVQAGAIEAWIANCPVVLPEAVTIGMRAMVHAASGRR